jgi:integrase
MDAALDPDAPCIHVRRAIVNGELTAPKSRHGRRTIPISPELADRLRELVARRGETELLFRGAHGAALRAGNLRYRVLVPAAQRAGVSWARFHTLRHTCAAMLIDAGASPLRLQRWMGHHSAAFTLDTYGHLLGHDLGPHLDVGFQMP